MKIKQKLEVIAWPFINLALLLVWVVFRLDVIINYIRYGKKK